MNIRVLIFCLTVLWATSFSGLAQSPKKKKQKTPAAASEPKAPAAKKTDGTTGTHTETPDEAEEAEPDSVKALTVPDISTPFEVRSRYSKVEYMIPMRDGIKLLTEVYIPLDAGKQTETGIAEYPFLINRTPYGVGPYGNGNFKTTLGPSEYLMRHGYIFVYQDVRGRNYSEGDFVDMRPYKPNKKSKQDTDESSDAYDTVEWMLTYIKGHNGKAGFWGISYGGFYSDMALIDAHPNVKAVSPQAPIADWYIDDDMHHNGAFLMLPSFNFFSSFGRARSGPGLQSHHPFQHGTPDGYNFFLNAGSAARADSLYFKGSIAIWNDMIAHPDYDEWWKARNTLPHFKNIKPAVLTVGGWFDAEDLYGPLKTYRAIEAGSPGADNYLVMGPWFHGGWARSTGEFLGNIHFGTNTSEYYQREIEFPFFTWFLKQQGKKPDTEAYIFETGSNRWREYTAWPLVNTKAKLWLQPKGGLNFEQDSAGPEFDAYISDPAHPVPHSEEINPNMTREFMTEDQRFASRRPDVLSYSTPPLAADITLSGPVTAHLNLSCSTTDVDVVVKLIDVLPDTLADNPLNPKNIHLGGYQSPVRMEVLRAKYRNSLEKPEPLIPNQVTPLSVPMQDVCHTFKKGHRIMVQVQSSWFPLIDRNPQLFTDIYRAKPADYQKAEVKLFHSLQHPGWLEMDAEVKRADSGNDKYGKKAKP